MVRRVLAGDLLIVLGLLLFASQLGSDAGRLVFGLALLAGWGGAGLGVITGRPWGRFVGLALAGVGLVGALFQFSQSGPGGQRALLEVFFLAGGPSFAWINVAIASAGFAMLSALAGALLILPLSSHEADPESHVT